MRKLFVLICALIILSSCHDEEKIVIKGYYPDGAGETLTLELLNVNQLTLIDSVTVKKNGRFAIHTELKNPELLLLKNRSGQLINLLSYPGDRIQITIPAGNYKTGYTIMGSSESEKIRTLVIEAEKTKFQLDSLDRIINKKVEAEEPLSEEIVATYETILKQQRMVNIKFIIENLSSLSSVYALYQRIGPDDYILNELNDLQYLKIVADSVGVKYPSSTLVSSLVQDVARKQQNYNSLLMMSKLSDQKVESSGHINLDLENTDGKMVSLKSLEGSVILINFWASWDKPSVDSNRQLKSIYRQYNSKGFEVYSVSLDNNLAAWRDAVRFEEYSWIDVCELTYPQSYAASIYNIQSLPTNFLIDREGNIVAKNVTGRVLSTWLDNLL